MQLKPIGYIKNPIKQAKFGGWQNLITEIVIDSDSVTRMKLDASDYVLKRNLHRLPGAVTKGIETVQVQRDYDRAVHQLKIYEECV